MKNIILKLLRDPKLYQYLLVGGISALVDIGLFLLLRQYLPFHYLVLATMSFAVATLVNYFLCNQFVFLHHHKRSTRIRFVLTYFVSGIGLSIHHATLFFSVESLGLPLVFSKIAAMGTAFGWNYLSRKHYVFAKESAAH